ncbi:CDP-alcohol phosphatidyltransferase family protein [Patescibacteria group bacterium]|nr:CDP-alcohol phosphatidyltransferase family protein [Patescibacteria group bacterium]MBU1931450.1 CDP-alcohol phosphatidyltransferase family protein [Patescibacteria group bacterium]
MLNEYFKTLTPQIITGVRPVLAGLALYNWFYGDPELAMFYYGVAAGTDIIDGPIARALEVSSEKGHTFDRLADIGLLASILIPHAIEYPVPTLTFVLGGILSYRAAQHGYFPERFLGKNSKILFGVSVGLFMLNLANTLDNPAKSIVTVGVVGGISLLAKLGIDKIGQGDFEPHG